MKALTKTITPTEQDVTLGTRDSCSTCPMALAIQRATKRFKNLDVSVTGHHAYLDNEKVGETFTALLPVRISKWIDRFDRGAKDMPPPAPFTLTFKVLE